MGPRITQVIALVVCVVLVAASSLLVGDINEGRKSLNMYGIESPTENAPPEYAFAIQAFGAFRGLITNIAFIRCEEYKREGKFYDAMQLASWICKLQPRFPSVWEFHAWNMAWNISVTTYTPEERWNWVYNGVKLIRDEGLKYNPRAINLYRQLAWIFVNKMGETTDEYNLVYKRNWAWRMHLVLGRPPDPLGEYRPGKPFENLDKGVGDDLLAEAARHAAEAREGKKKGDDPNDVYTVYDTSKTPDERRPLDYEVARKAAYDKLRTIAEASATLNELYEQTPETRELVGKLREMGVDITDATLTEDDYWRAEGLAFTFFLPYRRIQDPISLLARISAVEEENDAKRQEAEKLKAFDELVGATERRPAGLALLHFLQQKVLREVYKLEPAKMAELTEIFGPIDWREVDGHALYWVNEGLIAGDETISRFGNDKTNTARLIFFALHNLYRRNRLVFEPYYDDINYSYINYNPDLNFIESMHQAYLKYGKLFDPSPTDQGLNATFRTGHINFLSEAIRLLYFADRKREARRYFEFLRSEYGRTEFGDLNQEFDRSLDQFVEDSLLEEIEGHWETRATVAGLIAAGFDELAMGNLARYNQLVKKALALHAKYNQDKLKEQVQKMRLPPFREFQADVLRAALQQPSVSPGILVNKARLWGFLPLYLKHAVYDDVFEQLRAECAAIQFDLASAFPEPEGMDQYREERGRRGPQKDDSEVETPAQQIQ